MFKGYDFEDEDGYGYGYDDDDDYDYSYEDYGYDYDDYGDYTLRRDRKSDDDGFRRFEDYAHGREFLAKLATQRKTGEFLDMVVKVDGREFPCHRAVLAFTPYFKAMLSSNLAEGNSKVVQLRGIDSIIVSKILDFLYTGEIRIGNDDVQDILQAAHMLLFDRIVAHCREFVQDSLCPSNCLGVMRLADMYGFSALKLRAKKEAVSHFSEVGETEEFLSLSLEDLLDLLKDKDLKVDEDDVVHSVIRWLDQAPESRKEAILTSMEETSSLYAKLSALSKLESYTMVRECAEGLAKITVSTKECLTGTWQLGASVQGVGACGMSDKPATTVDGWKDLRRRESDYAPLRFVTSNYHKREVLAELARQRKTGEFLDLVINVEGRAFPSHRAVLASTPYLKTMLSSSFAEGNSKVVQLHGIDSISFSKILDFLYTGEICIGNDDVQDILQAAHMLQFDKIVGYCREFIQNNVCPTNCLGVMHLAGIYDFSNLKQKARKEAVSQFFSELSQNEEFLCLSPEELLDLLTDEELKVTTEDDVVYSVIRWLDHAPESRKTTVLPILDEIRLSCVRVSALRKLESHDAIRKSPECLAKITAALDEHLTGTRQPKSSAQEAEDNVGARRGMSDELAIIVGGWKAVKRQPYNESTTEPLPLQSVMCLEPDSQQYYHVANIPTPVLGYMSVTCAEGRLYITGGRAHPLVDQGHHSAPSGQAFCYDFASDTWMPLPDMPRSRAGHQSVVVDGNLFVVGGDRESTRTVLTMDCYNLEEEAWVKPPTPPTMYYPSILTLTALGNNVVLIEGMEVTLYDNPMVGALLVNLGYQIPPPLLYRSQIRSLCVNAFDVKTEHWMKSSFLVEHSWKDMDISATVDQDKLYIYAFGGHRNNIYVFDAQEETLTKMENRDVFTGNFFRTRREHRYADGQKGIVDSIINYKFEANRPEVEYRQTSLPFALFGHSFLGTKKSSAGWYCRDLEKLENEDEEDKD